MKTVSLLCDLQRLAPNDPVPPTGQTQWRFFSLNLTAAISGDPAAAGDISYLRSWDWVLGKVVVLGIDSGNRATPIAEDKVIVLPVPEPTSPSAPWKSALDTRLKMLLDDQGAPQNPDTFRWEPPQGTNGNLAQEVTYESDAAADSPPPGAQARWHAELLHFSTYPAPLPRLANLALFFKIDDTALAGVQRVIAVPRVTLLSGGAMREPMIPASLPHDLLGANGDPHFIDNEQSPVRWPYLAAGTETPCHA